MQIVVVGKGSFGQAMAYLLKKNKHDVVIAGRGDTISAEVVVMCVPVQSIRDVLPLITFPHTTKIIINMAKGIENTTHLFPFQIVNEFFKDTIEYYSLMGPSFSNEIMEDMPTMVNIGYGSKATYKEHVKKLFQTDFFRCKLTDGYELLEIASAMKNVYAIGCGISDALGYRENTRVTILNLAIEEMQQYFCSLTYKLCMDATGSMIGDLILTCSSHTSRNFQFGRLLVDHSPEEALRLVNSTIEGYNTIQSFEYFQTKTQVVLPLASFIAGLVKSNNRDIRKQFADFFKTI